MPDDILLYALVAAGLVFWLRSVLGTRHGEERSRPNPITTAAEEKTAPDQMTKPSPRTRPLADEDGELNLSSMLDSHMSIENEAAEQGLQSIINADDLFDLQRFMRGAEDTFVLIVESFAQGDREILHDLLHPSVCEAFERVLDDREEKGEKGEVEIHAVRKAEILSARMEGRMAFITVRFTADETSILRNAEGELIFGDPNRTTETIDIWTFGRDIRSRDPAWPVFETREDEADEVSGSTVPETENIA